MSKEEYTEKINALSKQEREIKLQRLKITDEFRNSMLEELAENDIIPGTKVSVKRKTWQGDIVDTLTYFYGVGIVWGEVKYVFHKIKKDGTMSQVKQYVEGTIISIHKI